jgi:hypothetical protein
MKTAALLVACLVQVVLLFPLFIVTSTSYPNGESKFKDLLFLFVIQSAVVWGMFWGASRFKRPALGLIVLFVVAAVTGLLAFALYNGLKSLGH